MVRRGLKAASILEPDIRRRRGEIEVCVLTMMLNLANNP